MTRVETAIFWKKSDKISSPGEWIEKVLENPGKLSFSESYQSVFDKRSRKWYPISLEKFIGALVKKRGELKKLAKETQDPKEKSLLNGKQNLMKLIINTLYGCLASPFFSIGNTVLADNITGRARGEVWKLCKSLNLRQSITDGGIYPPEQVNFWKESKKIKKPGLNVLSDVRRLQKHPSIRVGEIQGVNWDSVFKEGKVFENLGTIDPIILKHVKRFWEMYSLNVKIGLEHKLEHTSKYAIYTGKANYALKAINRNTNSYSEEVYKLRGSHVDEGEFKPASLVFHQRLLHGNDNLDFPFKNKKRTIMRVKMWKKTQLSKTSSDVLKSVLPGQLYYKNIFFRHSA